MMRTGWGRKRGGILLSVVRAVSVRVMVLVPVVVLMIVIVRVGCVSVLVVEKVDLASVLVLVTVYNDVKVVRSYIMSVNLNTIILWAV